jgi:glucose/arabinose dehydrogenase
MPASLAARHQGSTFPALRAVVVIGPDGALYVSTSNNEDDKILRVVRKGG